LYLLRIANGPQRWIAEKRYSDFVRFDEQLRAKFWYMDVPKLPAKRMLFNTDPDFISERRQHLEEYLRQELQQHSKKQMQ